jgi:hypothetical protein
MIGNHPSGRSGSSEPGPDRPLRDDREQKARVRQAAEALFAPKSPLAIIDKTPADPPAVSLGSSNLCRRRPMRQPTLL